MSKKAVIFLGPPGAGKGTISAVCEREFNWKHLSTGNVCREHILNKTDLGQEIALLISQGQLVPNQIIMQMIEMWIVTHQYNLDGIIFDGTPRTVEQSVFIDKMLEVQFRNFETLIIKFEVDEVVLMNRIESRVVCGNKDCQRVYSTQAGNSLQSKQSMKCDVCDYALVHRPDDSRETLKKRLDVYYQHEKDMLQYYKDKGTTILVVNAQEPVDQVFEYIKHISNC
ncbi:MAG: nucleoside monophosphate kinase [Candidatus Chromulinivorax sp.]|nr:nucleoside monophosphate kinase [Candidatus Chromulinivorax sp.]